MPELDWLSPEEWRAIDEGLGHYAHNLKEFAEDMDEDESEATWEQYREVKALRAKLRRTKVWGASVR